jgi:elongation factor P
VKPGKGQAFSRVRIRNLRTGRVIERTFKSGDSLEAPTSWMSTCSSVCGRPVLALHAAGILRAVCAGETAVGDAAQWLKDGTVCIVTCGTASRSQSRRRRT